LNIKCEFQFFIQFLSETFPILRGTERDIILNVQYIGFQLKYPLFLSDFNQICFSRQIFENTQMLNLMKIRPEGAEFFNAYRRTD